MTRHANDGARPGTPSTTATSARPLIAGPRWYRTRIRVLGPLFGLIPMGALGLGYWATTQLSDSRTSALLGLVAGVAAAPGLMAVGAPFADSSQYPTAILASGLLWLLLGFVAARRATRSPIASWRTYVRELFWLSIAVILGAIAALVAAAAVIGDPILA